MTRLRDESFIYEPNDYRRVFELNVNDIEELFHFSDSIFVIYKNGNFDKIDKIPLNELRSVRPNSHHKIYQFNSDEKDENTNIQKPKRTMYCIGFNSSYFHESSEEFSEYYGKDGKLDKSGFIDCERLVTKPPLQKDELQTEVCELGSQKLREYPFNVKTRKGKTSHVIADLHFNHGLSKTRISPKLKLMRKTDDMIDLKSPAEVGKIITKFKRKHNIPLSNSTSKKKNGGKLMSPSYYLYYFSQNKKPPIDPPMVKQILNSRDASIVPLLGNLIKNRRLDPLDCENLTKNWLEELNLYRLDKQGLIEFVRCCPNGTLAMRIVSFLEQWRDSATPLPSVDELIEYCNEISTKELQHINEPVTW
jgi:hypothetical protein